MSKTGWTTSAQSSVMNDRSCAHSWQPHPGLRGVEVCRVCQKATVSEQSLAKNVFLILLVLGVTTILFLSLLPAWYSQLRWEAEQHNYQLQRESVK